MAPIAQGWLGRRQGAVPPGALAASESGLGRGPAAALGFEQRIEARVAGAQSVDELVATSLQLRQETADSVAAWSMRGRATDVAGTGEATPAVAAAEVATLTGALSRLSDEVTRRAVQLVAGQSQVVLREACWLAFGSQARGEQTLQTDQDNGLVFAAVGEAEAEARRPAWQAFGQRVNEVLAQCGYPLCDGRVMAGQPLCCLSTVEWCRRFEHWMAHGDGNDLFAARIYFDTRPVAGNPALAGPLLEVLRSPAASVPRFIKQLADVVLRNRVPLGWLGRVVTTEMAGEPVFDLKVGGTALFVDAGRLWALAHRLTAIGTAPRMQAAAQVLRVPDAEAQTWVEGFQTLQRLRLQAQLGRLAQAAAGVPEAHAETHAETRAWVRWSDLAAGDRRLLERALRAARTVQQRIELDYCR